jgi:hypothetical protein
MAISSIGELRDNVRSWAERSDITDLQMNSFIALTESYANRILRVPSMEWRVNITSTEGRLIIPFDYLELRDISWLKAGIGSQERVPLEATTFQNVNFMRLKHTGGSVEPTHFARQGVYWFLAPMVADNEAFEVRYYRFIPALEDATNEDNWLLQVAPEVYLWGCLYFTYQWLQDETRSDYWQARFEKALMALQEQANKDQPGILSRVTNLDMTWGKV